MAVQSVVSVAGWAVQTLREVRPPLRPTRAQQGMIAAPRWNQAQQVLKEGHPVSMGLWAPREGLLVTEEAAVVEAACLAAQRIVGLGPGAAAEDSAVLTDQTGLLLHHAYNIGTLCWDCQSSLKPRCAMAPRGVLHERTHD